MGNTLFSKKEEEAVESTVKSTVLEESKTEKVELVDSSTKPEDDKKDESEIVDSSTKPEDEKNDERIATNEHESAAKKELNIQIKEVGKDLKRNANEEEMANKEEETAEKDAEDPNQSKDKTEPVTINETSESLKKNDVVEEKSNDVNNDGNEDLTKQREKPKDEIAVMTEEQNETKATTDGTSNGETVTAGVKRKDSPVTTNNVDAAIDGKMKRAKVNKDDDNIDEDIETPNDVESSSSKDAVVA